MTFLRKISSFRAYFFLVFIMPMAGCSKKEEAKPANLPPSVQLSGKLIKTSPITFEFFANAADQEFDPLTYTWDFGNGTKTEGKERVSSTYEEGKTYTIKVTVSDGKSTPTVADLRISTEASAITLDATKKFQTIEGFGGFGGQDVYWSGGPFTSERFVNDVVNDLGCTIIRDEMPTAFEIENDNNDPNVTDLSKFNLSRNIDGHHAPFNARLPHFKAMKIAGVEKFIVSVWSPAPWMKWNNRIDNGTKDNAAPAYNKNPTATSNQLKAEYYEEFAESCAAYCKIFKRDVGVDLYGFSIQNEPRFSQSYQSCVYNGETMRDVIKVVGARFKKDGIPTKLFLPEDVGWYDGANGLVTPTLNDPQARQYLGAVATHGYAFDGINAGKQDAQTWQNMYNWGSPYNLPLWMTETSGFKNTPAGAIEMASAMYTAMRFGNASAWVFWTLSTGTLDEYSLMSSAGQKGKRYYVSKQFYRYIRPGAVRIEINATEKDILPLAFTNKDVTTIVLINVGTADKMVKINGAGQPSQYKVFRTAADDDCKSYGEVAASDVVLVPAQGVLTLYSGK